MNFSEAMQSVKVFLAWPQDVREFCLAMHSGTFSKTKSVSEVRAASDSAPAVRKRRKKNSRRKFTQSEEKDLVVKFERICSDITRDPSNSGRFLPSKISKKIAREYGCKPLTLSRKYTAWFDSNDWLVNSSTAKSSNN